MTKTLLGHTTVGRTTCQVYRLDGYTGKYALEGPRGACYFVTDHGPAYQINSVAIGGARPWTPVPRPLRGLTRAHLALVLETAAATEGQVC